MKPFELLLAQGPTIQEALTALSNQIKEDYNDKACELSQIFLLQEYRQIGQVATAPSGQPSIQVIYNVVAVISEERATDHLQRNYKPMIDFLNDNAGQFIPMLQAILASYIGTDFEQPTMPGV